ncbi:hypothetical protein AGMMS50256_34060 [Betaproteobacteria bacterium]|nr:hypothetical protein AGMMS50256_34060 [Betaproteobacteria bacterium]
MSKKSTTATFADDVPIIQSDIDSGKLILRERVNGKVVPPSKQRVTLYLDAALVDHFKRLSGARGYQTLINDALKSSLYQAEQNWGQPTITPAPASLSRVAA